MADAILKTASRAHKSKGKRTQEPDPEEGPSGIQNNKKAKHHRSSRVTEKPPPSSSKHSKDEERRHKAMERAFQKASSHQASVPQPATAPSGTGQEVLRQPPSVPPLSPDRSLQEDVPSFTEAASVFPTVQEQAVPDQGPDLLLQGEVPQIEAQIKATAPASSNLEQVLSPALASLIADSIGKGIAQGLQERASSRISEYLEDQASSLRSQPLDGNSQGQERQRSPSRDSQSSISLEEEAIIDQELSEDEGLEPDQPSFVGLFCPQMFQSLLFKAQMTTRLGIPTSKPKDSSNIIDSMANLFEEPAVAAETIPAPKLFSDVLQRQWKFPSSGPSPNSLDKKFYNLASEYANLLQIPTVDAPVLALASPSPVLGPPEESLPPEDRKTERSLIKGHQASAWSVQAASAASFFNRASILWLKQLQSRLPASEVRAHQDINKIMAAVEFSADATLNAARFSAKAIGSTVTSRCLLWLKHWQADVRNKWRLASSSYAGDKLFGAALDPLLIETRDHRKVLPALSQRSDFRQVQSFRSSSFRSSDTGSYHQWYQCSYPTRGPAFQDNQVRQGPHYPPRRFPRGGRGRPFRRAR
ncbi:neuronal membrane glycoprotein M6-b isoform X1 [Pantherophis guttatus]|uniref:Neuronal membrane glycoprotein M6-b isoform X1 n=1 Tax=Pantherophis guttatus TaxID=94885 RepID=A0ABM3Z2T0_PANGU|nr:neuronal membrane glycoprotein M6-b isoform X1 [Pantherophis guttatus]